MDGCYDHASLTRFAVYTKTRLHSDVATADNYNHHSPHHRPELCDLKLKQYQRLQFTVLPLDGILLLESALIRGGDAGIARLLLPLQPSQVKTTWSD